MSHHEWLTTGLAGFEERQRDRERRRRERLAKVRAQTAARAAQVAHLASLGIRVRPWERLGTARQI